jgi:MFS family permease
MLFSAGSAGMLTAWHDHPWQILAAMPILGLGVGFAFAAMATLITEAVRPEETGIATGMNTVMRTVGGVIGGQVGAAILAAGVIGGTSVPTAHAYATAFGIAAAAALVGTAVAVFIPAAGRQEQYALGGAD